HCAVSLRDADVPRGVIGRVFMTATAKRYFLIGYLGLAGLAAVACGVLLLSGSGYRQREEAMMLGVTSGYCLILILMAFTAMDRRGWRTVAVAGMAVAVAGMLHMT